MDENQSKQKKSALERYAYKVFYRIPEASVNVSDEFQTLSDTERQKINNVTLITLSLAALWGALSVLLLYIPQYIFPTFFSYSVIIPIPFFNTSFELAWISTTYGILLVVFEMYLLALLNLYAVRQIAISCGFPAFVDPNYEKHIDALIAAGLEQPNTNLKTYGIDPYYGIPKIRVYALVAYAKLKAAISNVLFRMLVKRLLGRYALRVVLDMSGIPVYAFWNALASYSIIKEAKNRIMGPSLINQLRKQQKNKYPANDIPKELMFQAIQFIAIAKMAYHHNIYLLASTIFNEFEVSDKYTSQTAQQFIINMKTADSKYKEGLMQLVLFGLMIDGELSIREKLFIRQFNKEGILSVKSSTIDEWTAGLNRGKGLENFFKSKLT